MRKTSYNRTHSHPLGCDYSPYIERGGGGEVVREIVVAGAETLVCRQSQPWTESPPPPPPCLKSPKYNALCLSGTVCKQNNNKPVFYLTVSSHTHNLSDVVGAVVCGAGGPHNHPPAACLPAPQVHLQQSWRPGIRHTRQARPRYY